MEHATAEFVPLAVIAARLGISPQTLRDQVKRGEFPGRKIGGRWKVAETDYRAFKAGNWTPERLR